MNRDEREEAVDWFCMRMKLKLREPRNEVKGSWRDDDYFDLWDRMTEEGAELFGALRQKNAHEAIISEAIDVAAYSMMVADRARQLKG